MILRLLMLTGWMALTIASTPGLAQMRQVSRQSVDSLLAAENLSYGREPLDGAEQEPDTTTYGSDDAGVRPGRWAVNISWFMYALVGVLLLLVGWVVLKQFAGGSGKQVRMAAAGIPGEDHDLSETNFDHLIREAEGAEDWRLALRYHHLLVLRQLQDRGLIRWNQHKTDSDYVAELKDPDLADRFRQLAYVFGYFWYGEHQPTRSQYQRLLTLIRPFA